MDFALPEHLQRWRQTLREFCQREIRPNASAWDREQRFPLEFVPRLAELGLFGISIPVDYAGVGMGMLALAVAVEELARADASLALTVASHNGLAVQHLVAVGTEEQKRKYLPRAASGEWLAAWALTEPHAGSDSAAITTTASETAGGWVLSGRKTFVSQGSIGGFCVVMARTGSKGRGMTAFLVDRGTRGFTVSRTIEKCGCRASDTAEIAFDECNLPDTARLGGVGAAFYDAMRILDRGRIAVAAMALGIGRAAHATALAYATRREAFGRTLLQHQAIQFKCVDARLELDAAELLIHRAAALIDTGKACVAEAAMAKVFASEAATRVCNDAMQIHGGTGYTTDCEVERYLRDVKLCEIAEGTSEIQRLIIARHLVDR